MANNLITENFTLPSKGKLYPNCDGTITLRMMTTKEERMRLSTEAFYDIMSLIINECIVDNKNPDGSYKLDSKNFTEFDFFAVMVKLRSISYGPQYKTVARCTQCGKSFNYEANLSNLICNPLPDDFVEPFTIGPLPFSNDTIACKFLRVRDRINMEKEKKRMLSQFPNYIGDPLYMLEMEKQIVSINDKELNNFEKQQYVDNMSAMDSNYFHRVLEKHLYGILRLGTTTCTDVSCGGVSLYSIRADSEFFRPTLDI